jgi:hypothetical protein
MQAAKTFFIRVGVITIPLLIIGLILAVVFHASPLDILYSVLITLALFLIVATIFQIYSIILFIRTIKTVRNEMRPLVSSVQETVGIVQDTARTAGKTVSTINKTAKLTSELALSPAIHATAALVAAQGMLRIFLSKGHVRTRAEQRQRAQMEAMHASQTERGEQ